MPDPAVAMSGRAPLLLPIMMAGLLGIAGCAGTVPGASPALAPVPSVEAVPSVEIPPDATVVELSISAEGRGHAPFQRNNESVDRIEVKADQPYVFRVTNPGRFDHNFWIGAADDLAAREYDRLKGVHIWNDGVREIVYTFEGEGAPLQFACTLAGHYGRMHGDFVVVP
jgi:uncharacterized cupredoxin-like copper-binding protein